MGVFRLGGLGDGFPVRNPRYFGFYFDFLLFVDPVKNHTDMELTHTGYYRLLCLRVVADSEGWVFFGGPLKPVIHLVFIFLVYRRNRQRVDGLRHVERLVFDRGIRGAKGIPG